MAERNDMRPQAQRTSVEVRQLGTTDARLAAAERSADENGDVAEGHPFEGYASVFDQRTWIGNPDKSWGFYEEIAPTAFNKSLGDGARGVTMLHNHQTAIVLASVRGGTLRLSTDDYGLRAEAEMAPTWGQPVAESIRRGDIAGMSFGFQPVEETARKLDDGTMLFRVTEARLYEVSTVAYPAYDGTEAANRQADLWAARLLALPDEMRAELAKTIAPPATLDGTRDGDPNTEDGPTDATRIRARAITRRHAERVAQETKGSR